MPSMRPHPLNPHAPAGPAPRASPLAAVRAEPLPPPPPASATQVPAHIDADSAADEAARAGGFHESSYELTHGLQVSESEWPDDVTMPGALDEH